MLPLNTRKALFFLKYEMQEEAKEVFDAIEKCKDKAMVNYDE